MIRQARPLAEIATEALKVLYREIGIVDTLRFVSQYTTGYGDYTAQRDELFAGMTLDDIVSEIKQRRKLHPLARKAQPKKRATGKHLRSRREGRQKPA